MSITIKLIKSCLVGVLTVAGNIAIAWTACSPWRRPLRIQSRTIINEGLVPESIKASKIT